MTDEGVAVAGEVPIPQGRVQRPVSLPSLRGRGLSMYNLLWMLALIPALVAPFAGSLILFQRGAAGDWLPYGIVTLQDSTRVQVVAVLSGEAAASGVRSGETIIAAQGVRIPSRNYRERLAVKEGASVTVITRSENGIQRSHQLIREGIAAESIYERAYSTLHMTQWAERLVELILQLVPIMSLVAAASFLFARREDSVAALLSLSFLLISASKVPVSFLFWAEYRLNWFSAPLGHFAWALLALGLFAFPSGRFEPRWTMWLAAAVPLWLAAVAGISSGSFEIVGYVLLLPLGVAALGARYLSLPPGQERQQLRWVFFGFSIGAVALVSARILLWQWNALIAQDVQYVVLMPLIGHLLIALGIVSLSGGLLVALLRYRLYDADMVLSRSAAVAALTLILAAFAAAGAKGVEFVVEAGFGPQASAWPSLMGAALAVMLVSPLHNQISLWAERRFQKALLRLRRDLPACAADLRETADLPTLLEEVLARVEVGVRAVRSAVMIEGEAAAARGILLGKVTGADFPLAVPLRAGHDGAEVGTLLVGPRPDGSRLGKDEREALEEIADSVARAVRVVLARDARERALETRLTAIEKRLAQRLSRPPAK